MTVFLKHFAHIINGYIATQLLRLLNMAFIIAAIDGTISQFSNSYLRGTKVLAANLSCVFSNTTAFMEIFYPCACVKNIFLHQSSKWISRIYTFLRPSLMAASIRAASTGSSAQQPQRLQNSRSFSSSVISCSANSSLNASDDVSIAASSIFTVLLRSFNISQYRRLMGQRGVKTVPVIIVLLINSATKILQINETNKQKR